MVSRKIVFLIGALVFSVNIAFAKDKVEYRNRCFDLPKEIHKKGKYCLTDFPGQTGEKVLYYFHGIFGSPYSFARWGKNKSFHREWQKSGKKFPSVISMSFGRRYLVTPKNSMEKSGLLETIINKVIPYLEEKHFPTLTRDNRLLMGVSMGGFNSSQIIMRNPGFFKAFAMQCPAFTEKSPHSTKEEVKDFIKRTNASWLYVKLALNLGGKFYANKQEWNAQAPLHFYRNRRSALNLPPSLIVISNRDEFGFHEGGHKFYNLLKSRNEDIKLIENNETHCGLNSTDVVKFLSQY